MRFNPSLTLDLNLILLLYLLLSSSIWLLDIGGYLIFHYVGSGKVFSWVWRNTVRFLSVSSNIEILSASCTSLVNVSCMVLCLFHFLVLTKLVEIDHFIILSLIDLVDLINIDSRFVDLFSIQIAKSIILILISVNDLLGCILGVIIFFQHELFTLFLAPHMDYGINRLYKHLFLQLYL